MGNAGIVASGARASWAVRCDLYRETLGAASAIVHYVYLNKGRAAGDETVQERRDYCSKTSRRRSPCCVVFKCCQGTRGVV